MKQLFKYLFKKKIILIITLIFSFSLGFFIANIYNYNISYYQCDFEVSDSTNFNYELLEDVDFLNSIKASGYNETTNTNKYENINVEKMLKNNDFEIIKHSDNSFTIITSYKYYDVFFVLSTQKLSNRAKTFIKDALSYLAKDNITITYKQGNNIVSLKNNVNNFVFGTVFMIVGLMIALCILVILYYKNFEIQSNIIYDNLTIYNTIFCKQYWIDSFNRLKKTKDLTILSFLFALMLICKLIPIPSGFGNLGLSFTYLFMTLIGIIFGPFYGFIIGILSDTIGFFINSTGYFFLGYTIQAALTGMIYGLFFYKTKINFTRVFICRLIINMIMNVLYGSICYTIVFTDFSLFSSDFNSFLVSYITLLSLPKNIIYLLPQSLFLFYFIKICAPILKHYNLINKNIYEHIKLL